MKLLGYIFVADDIASGRQTFILLCRISTESDLKKKKKIIFHRKFKNIYTFFKRAGLKLIEITVKSL